MITRATIDPNIRVRGNMTYVGIEDLDGPVGPGDTVIVEEPESQISGLGVVDHVDHDSDLVYLRVDWAGLRHRDQASGLNLAAHLRVFRFHAAPAATGLRCMTAATTAGTTVSQMTPGGAHTGGSANLDVYGEILRVG